MIDYKENKIKEKRKLGDPRPKTWIIQLIIGAIFNFVIGGGIFGTIGTILFLVGFANFILFIYLKTKNIPVLRFLVPIILIAIVLLIVASLLSGS